jgi:diguanylate cyclase (GGDEF)-like protein
MLVRLQNIILEMIARGEPLKPTMDRLCLEVEAIVPGTVCSVLTVDESQRIHPLSAPNLPAAYCAGFAGALIGPDMGSCGTAAFRVEPVSVADLRSDPLWANVDVSHLPSELVACWSSPILDARQRVLGTFAFYFREHRGPTEIEEEAVAACAQLCAIAIERDAQKVEHDRLALTDTLTGLANRAGFNEALTTLQQENPGAWGLLLIDLDNLKKVNDTFGHPCGDRLLAGAAESIASVVPRERAFRIGGDELAVLLPLEEGKASLVEVAEKILDALKTPMDYLGHAIVRSATAGGAIVTDENVDVESVKRNADLALYHAKEMGRRSREWQRALRRRATPSTHANSWDGAPECWAGPRSGLSFTPGALARVRSGRGSVAGRRHTRRQFAPGYLRPVPPAALGAKGYRSPRLFTMRQITVDRVAAAAPSHLDL